MSQVANPFPEVNWRILQAATPLQVLNSICAYHGSARQIGALEHFLGIMPNRIGSEKIFNDCTCFRFRGLFDNKYVQRVPTKKAAEVEGM